MDKVPFRQEAKPFWTLYRQAGKRIVLQRCIDILHVGQVRYLKRRKAWGSLVLGSTAMPRFGGSRVTDAPWCRGGTGEVLPAWSRWIA
jgi:hypothetical protein